MSIIDTIRAVSLAERKARNAVNAASLSTLLGEIENLAKAGKGELNDAVVVTVVKKFIKNIGETMAVATHPAVQEALKLEHELYAQFLPKQLSEDELKTLIDRFVAEGAKDVGDAMKRLKLEFAGTYDGAVASKLLKETFK